jgi:rod shape-determining protein MreD
MSRLYAVPLGALALVLVTSVQRLPVMDGVLADPCAILVAYLAYRSDVAAGAASAMLLGALMDVGSGGLVGLHMLSCALLFVVLRMVANVVQVAPGLGLFPIAVAAGLAHMVLLGMMVALFSATPFRLMTVWQTAAPSVVANAVLALPLLAAVHAVALQALPDSEPMFLSR